MKKWFRKTSLYYWVVLIIWPSMKAAIPITEARGRIIEILISLIVSLLLIYSFGIAFQKDLRINFVTFLFWLLITFLLRFIESILYLPAKLYKEEKRKADRLNWNDVNLYCEDFVDGVGYKVRLENHKDVRFSFLVELSYLELDGLKEEFSFSDKSRMLLWLCDDDHNRSFGLGIAPNSSGFYELSNSIEIPSASVKEHKIVWCEYNRNDRKRPIRKYSHFTKFAQGELRLHGVHVTRPISSMNYTETKIMDEIVYKFRIEIKNDKPIKTKFERGIFELHADARTSNISEI